ncbi:MAG: hypothetical protein AAGD32_08175, partial [Planctomycetota bacterium]
DAIRLNWIGDPSEHVHFRIYRSTDGVDFDVLGNVSVSEAGLGTEVGPATWVDTTVESGKKYWYRIRGYNPLAGYSHTTNKNWAVATMPTPTNVQVSEPNDYELDLTWDPVHPNADHVVIHASFDGAAPEVWTLPKQATRLGATTTALSNSR